MHNAIKNIEGIGVYLAPRPLITVLGVKYLHLRVEDGTDLYVTEFGLPFAKCLMPENHWGDVAWMKAHGTRLPGTSALFRVRTKQVDGRPASKISTSAAVTCCCRSTPSSNSRSTTRACR